VAETVITSGIRNTLNLYQSALVVRVLLTWFPNPPAFIAQPLSTICDPYLNLFRGIIPPIGGTIDLSPILAFVVLDLCSGSAASLSAELPGKADKEA
jgi:YggT family protein